MISKSQSGVKYLFDESLGISVPYNPLLEKYFNDSSDIPVSTEVKDSEYISKFIRKLKILRESSNHEKTSRIEPCSIKKQILRYGLLQMTLCVTEDCNLACKYCYFSDSYEYSRKPTHRKMNFETAKSSLDYFISLLKESKKYNPKKEPAIGFYGGEPLLNFDLIKKCVNYISDTYSDIDLFYTITTNGTLLDEKKADFLMLHNFAIAVSLDGPQSEHDRNRVYSHGEGTYQDVICNVNRIMSSGYPRIRSVAVFDWKSDLFCLQDFFNTESIPKLVNITMPNPENGCKYYNQFSREDLIKFTEMEKRAFELYLQSCFSKSDLTSFFDQLFGIRASKAIYSYPSLIPRNSFLIPYSGACIPGRKLFVDIDGKFHVCERVNLTIPIGDVKEGLDFERISDLIKNYLIHLDKCPTCDAKNLCGKCYQTFEREGHFCMASKICDNVEMGAERELSRAYTLGEKNPRLLGSVIDDYYSMISQFSKTMED